MWIGVPICRMTVLDAAENSMKLPDITKSVTFHCRDFPPVHRSVLDFICTQVVVDCIVLVEVLHQAGVVFRQLQACGLWDCVVPDERAQRYENVELRHEAEYFGSRHAPMRLAM